MNLIAISAILLMLNAASASGMQEATPSQSYAVSQQNEDAVLRRVRPVLRASGYAGLIAYSGRCGAKRAEFVEFPRIDLHSPSGATALERIREIFKNDAAVKVATEPGKVIMITIGTPLAAILRTRISLIQLAPIGQYNPFLAFGAVLDADEVKAELKRLNFHTPHVFNFGMLVAEPAPGLPHLPATLRNVTVVQVLNLIARKFDGIVIYRTCVQPSGAGLVKINFVGLAK